MNLRQHVQSVTALGYMLSIAWIRRNRMSLVWLFATPFSFLFLLTVITNGRAFAIAAAGSLLLILVTVGTGLAGDAAWYRIELKLQDYFVASQVSQADYLLGIALAGLFYSMPAVAVLTPLIIVLGLPLYNLPLAVLAGSLVWLFTSTLGYLVSTYLPNSRNGWQAGLFMSTILGVLPPVFYPIEAVPKELVPLAYLAPTTHASLIMRELMGQTPAISGWSPLISWTFLAASFAIMLACTWAVAQWRQS
jgi:ABC-2 type transport system permease protein